MLSNCWLHQLKTFFHSLQDVSKQLWSTLYDFPELKNCTKVKEYIYECVRLSWMLVVQVPPMSIEYEATEFSDKLHGRFMTSDMKCFTIKYHVWPALIDSQAGHMLYRGTVVTWLECKQSGVAKNINIKSWIICFISWRHTEVPGRKSRLGRTFEDSFIKFKREIWQNLAYINNLTLSNVFKKLTTLS